MAKRFDFLVLMFISVFYANTTVEARALTDTIYYLIDNTPKSPNDKSITIVTANDYLFFTIDFPCLKDNTKPIFRANIKKRAPVSAFMLKSIKFIRQQDLISLIKAHPGSDDRIYDNLLFIVRNKNGIFKYKVHFLGGSGINVID